ncbi:MAG: DegT/DnrJ/EryC1/StrS aminotransferase family protein [Bdellovibrionota bacterium]|nr:DegT/DnrJ/EryC1/StrS aminotransferase family protein [Bdellovibrionota bacterium]
MPFIDLKTQYQNISEEINGRINDVLNHSQFILGPEVKELESELASYVEVKHAIGCSSGTDALLLALMALDIKRGDEVIVPDFSFFATSEVVSFLGATPIFVDIDPVTYNISPTEVEKAITTKTKAIIAVSLYGQCADYDRLNKLGVPVIEDGAQSFGATYKGKKSCSLTTIGCTSFFPSKPLGCYGDGGALFTNDDQLNEKMRQLLAHGQSKRYVHSQIGINGRLDTIQAAILLEKLKIFEKEIQLRHSVASRYDKGLKGKFKTPTILEENTSVYAQYTIEVEDRERFQSTLKEKGIPTAIHYPKPLSKQPIYSDIREEGINPLSQSAADRVVSLPFSPYLTEEAQDFIIKEVQSFS